MKQRQVITVVVASAVAATGVAVVALTRASTPAGQTGAAGAAPAATTTAGPPIVARLQKIDITPADPKAGRADVPQRGTERFSLLGLTWIDPKLAVGTVQVRTRALATGAWSAWRSLDADDGLGPDAREAGGTRGGTDPLWVGASNGVAARVLSASGRSAQGLPAGLRLDLINPDPAAGSGGQGGGEPDPSASASDDPSAVPDPSDSAPTGTVPPTTAPATTPTTSSAPTATATPTSTTPTGAPLPSYVTRAGWQANEKIVKGEVSYGTDVKVLFVHHTAGTNSYSCADSPSIIRGIEAYQVQSKGWNDIGYNFLTDKCGTLYEGRKGGVDKPVLGAHTYGFNTNSAAIAVLGTYIDSGVPAATATTIARVAAYKLGLYGYSPSSTAKLTEAASDGKFPLGQVVTFNRISGHRDAVATECPGDALYAQLKNIRVEAASGIWNLAVKAPPGYVPGKVTLSWSVGTPTSQIGRFDLLVDGKVAGTAAASARSAPVSLAAGTRKLQVRAVHVSGNSATSSAVSVVSDTTAPTYPTPPWLSLRSGTVSATAVPVQLNWTAADGVKLASVAATAPTSTSFAPTTTAWATSAKPSVSTTWKLTAKDAAGNAGSASVARTTMLVAETSAKRTGSWTTASSSSYLGGKALKTGTKSRKLSWTFTGRAASLIFDRGTKTGKVDIYLDGKKVATLDTKAGSTHHREASWSKSFATGKHTVSIVVLATSGRPTVISDGLAYLK